MTMCYTIATAAAGWSYVCPEPGAARVPPGTTVALRDGREISPASVAALRLLVTGTTSGVHSGRLVLSDDRRTVIFTPDRPFALGERVSVVVPPGLRTTEGDALPALASAFTTSGSAPRRVDPAVALGLPATPRDATPLGARPAAVAATGLPAAYQAVTVMQSNAPDTSGVIFVAPWSGPVILGRLEIVDNAGQPLFFRKLPRSCLDWKRQPTGLLTYHDGVKYYGLDSTYAVVDSFEAGNGYGTDVHDCQVLPNGHALLMSYDYEPYPMDTVVAGGKANARVIGAIVQELDTAKNVVFQWRSWDHFLVTDADTCLVSLRDTLIDYVHSNALEVDTDGHLLMSSRHMNEITKIDRNTGAVMWRMGANAKHNQFTFVGDTRAVTAQHDIRRLPNGHLTMFDNGNCTLPHYSRGVEYQLDETNHVATRVWEFRNAPDSYGPFMGNVQRLPSGGSMICWGGTGPDPKMTEVHADGTVALQLGWNNGVMWSYRAFRFPWTTSRFAVTPAALDFGATPIGQSTTRALKVRNRLATPLTITGFAATDSAFSADNALPIVVPASGETTLTLRFAPRSIYDVAGTFYVRSANDTELVAQSVALVGHGPGPAVSISGMSVTEGNAGTRVFGFQVTPSATPAKDIVVQYQTVDGSAKASDNDFVAVSGSISIPVGAAAGVVPVTVVGDIKAEADETFYVRLLSPVGATLGGDVAQGVILNDDGPLGVDSEAALPTEFALHAAAPTPVRERTTLRFDLPRAAHVWLAAYDVRGRRIETLLDADRPAGRHQLRWSPGLADGVYFVRMDADGVRRVQRIVLLR